MMRIISSVVAAVMSVAGAASAHDALVVHEWGTFTSFQDEAGRALGGINTDDEPVPDFVYQIRQYLKIPTHELAPVFVQGAPRAHPHVTLRLETPVVYFHPGGDVPVSADVEVSFHGGWLTEFYPAAAARAPGIGGEEGVAFGPLTADTLGRLSWRGLRIGEGGAGPETTEHVWLAPRDVEAASVTTAGGESEKFLFYRGLAHLDAPLRVARSADGQTLEIHGQWRPPNGDAEIAHLWLVEVRPDGTAAFRTLDAVRLSGDDEVLTTTAAFDPGDFDPGNLARLREAMHGALVEAGLFADEARALLNTWELSYFRSDGLRLFFLVPPAWTDEIMPLKISASSGEGEARSLATDVTRVMIGRIELVTPRQRELLRRIASGPTSRPDWYFNGAPFEPEVFALVASGRKPLASLGLDIPPDYQAYIDLGRFRNALVLDEARRRSTSALDAFIRYYGLAAHEVAEE